MTKLLLANFDVRNHVTSENTELQDGLAAAGWKLAGFGFDPDNCVDVPTLLDRHRPDIVLVMPREDWDESSPGCYDKRCSFRNIAALARHPAFKVQVVKDQPGAHDRRQAWCAEIGCNAIVHYYHRDAVVPLSPWMRDYTLIRTWHSIDRDKAMALCPRYVRKRGVVSGATNVSVYPLRTRAVQHAAMLRIDHLRHPGYQTRHCHSDEYLTALSGYKVHVATASRFGFALRKIIESIAVGCTVVTDLPAFDVLPAIDDALVRVPADIKAGDLGAVIDRAESAWEQERAMLMAQQAWDYYDWRDAGLRLDKALTEEAAPCPSTSTNC